MALEGESWPCFVWAFSVGYFRSHLDPFPAGTGLAAPMVHDEKFDKIKVRFTDMSQNLNTLGAGIAESLKNTKVCRKMVKVGAPRACRGSRRLYGWLRRLSIVITSYRGLPTSFTVSDHAA